MQTDVETADAWWRREDPTRTPRFDTFAFPCGTQLDITLLRLPADRGRARSDRRGARERIYSGLQAPNLLLAQYEKTVVYYDGPDSQGRPTVCGEGGGPIAFVYVNACEGVPNDGIVIHELIHSLGAVQPQAPHICPEPNGGHTCDTVTDIMYPFADGSNLFALLMRSGSRRLLRARGRAGSTCRTREFLVRLDAQTPLSLSVLGAGRVTSDIPGVDCSEHVLLPVGHGHERHADGHARRPGSASCAGAAAVRARRHVHALSLAQAAQVSALFAPAHVRAAGRRQRQGDGARRLGSARLSRALRRGGRLVHPHASRRHAGEGLAVQGLVGHLPRDAAGLHAADEEGVIGPRHASPG